MTIHLKMSMIMWTCSGLLYSQTTSVTLMAQWHLEAAVLPSLDSNPANTPHYTHKEITNQCPRRYWGLEDRGSLRAGAAVEDFGRLRESPGLTRSQEKSRRGKLFWGSVSLSNWVPWTGMKWRVGTESSPSPKYFCFHISISDGL